jgi:tetratricopeptide (TPR) repeat protein
MSGPEDDLLRRIARAEDALESTIWAYARFCQQQKCPERAIPRVVRMAEYERDPQRRASLLLAIGQLHETGGDYRGAVEAYGRGHALGPTDPPVRYFLRNNEGYALNQLGAYALAEVCLREAISIDPSRHNAHKNLGLALEGQGRFVEAAEALACAIESCPENRRALNHLEELLTRNDPSGLPPNFSTRVEHCRRLVARARPELN